MDKAQSFTQNSRKLIIKISNKKNSFVIQILKRKSSKLLREKNFLSRFKKKMFSLKKNKINPFQHQGKNDYSIFDLLIKKMDIMGRFLATQNHSGI